MTFTTFTLVASFILFRGFNTTDPINTISLLCGFLTIFTGVYLLNLSREDPDGNNLGIASSDHRGTYHEVDGIPTDGLAGLQTRFSMQSRRSGEHRRSQSWSLRSPGAERRSHSVHLNGNDATMYDLEANSLKDLAEESDEDTSDKWTSFGDANGHANGEGSSVNRPGRAQRPAKSSVPMGGKAFDQPKR